LKPSQGLRREEVLSLLGPVARVIKVEAMKKEKEKSLHVTIPATS
jgi:hypothetical protein